MRKIRIMSLIVAIVMIFVTIPIIGYASDRTLVVSDFEDPNMLPAILSGLEKVSITESELLDVKRIVINASEIESLKGLNVYAKNMEDIYLSAGKFKTLEGLEGMTNLTRLVVYGGGTVEDISAIKDLTNLNELHVFVCNLKDTSPIEKLTKLKILSLSRNKITEMCDLKSMTQLTTFEANENNITGANLCKILPGQLNNNEFRTEFLRSQIGTVYVEQVISKENITFKTKVYRGTEAVVNIQRNSTKTTYDLQLDPKNQTIGTVEFSIPLNGIKKFRLINNAGKEVSYKMVSNKIVFTGSLGKYTIDTATPIAILKSVKPGKLTTKVKKITGVTTAKATVKLMSGSKTIKKVIAKTNGKFTISKLNLKKYKKKTLKLVVSKSGYKSKTKKFAKIKK